MRLRRRSVLGDEKAAIIARLRDLRPVVIESAEGRWASMPPDAAERLRDRAAIALIMLNRCHRLFTTDVCGCRACRVRRTNAQVAQALRDWQATP